jgi:hypothetical protein
MNRLVDLTLQHLQTLDLDGDELVHEALLRRGYPVLHERGALWMPRGPHQGDLAHLGEHLDVVAVVEHPRYRARIELGGRGAWEVAVGVLSIPSTYMSRGGVFRPWHMPGSEEGRWRRYREQHHGHPAVVGCDGHRGGLDLGVALVTKVLPIVGVSTSGSCDGHAERPMYLGFTTVWDGVWCRAVLDVLGIRMPAARVTWSEDGESVNFEPTGGFTDESLVALLDDLQRLGRRLLDSDLGAAARRARSRVLASFKQLPGANQFGVTAREVLSIAALGGV